MKSLAVWLAVPALSLGACATVPPTPEQVAACQEMERDMGVGVRHDHAEMKQQGRNPMNLSHDQCRRILADQGS
ncbi:hypothetical protein [Altererythrobacter lauratis]|jgi:hypothetical protein|uniref:Lipoprotein n=1 Tax=Alteraurantiacibacter lauratis TaxID=2054627 RepID=A0ABV7EAI8_9SPHN